MTPEEALILLVQADPNRSYTVSRHDSAHVPAFAGQPPNLRTTWDVCCNPGIGPEEWQATGLFSQPELAPAVLSLCARLEREKARQTLAMAFPAETKPHEDFPQSIGKTIDLREGAE